MDHCLQQISSEVPIILPVRLRGKLPLLCCPAKGFPGSGTLRREENLSKDTARLAGQQEEALRWKGSQREKNRQLRGEKMPKERHYRGAGGADGRGGHRNSLSTAQTR